jgi:hypothetical protein
MARCARQGRAAFSVTSVFSVVDLLLARGEQGSQAAVGRGRGGGQGDELGRAQAVDEAVAAGAG